MARRRSRALFVIFAFAAMAALLASSAAMATAVGFSGGAEGMLSSSLHAQRRVEDDAMSSLEDPKEAYPRRRALYSGGHIGYGALTASKAACYGPCPARGQAYSRGCQAIYQCRG